MPDNRHVLLAAPSRADRARLSLLCDTVARTAVHCWVTRVHHLLKNSVTTRRQRGLASVTEPLAEQKTVHNQHLVDSRRSSVPTARTQTNEPRSECLRERGCALETERGQAPPVHFRWRVQQQRLTERALLPDNRCADICDVQLATGSVLRATFWCRGQRQGLHDMSFTVTVPLANHEGNARRTGNRRCSCGRPTPKRVCLRENP